MPQKKLEKESNLERIRELTLYPNLSSPSESTRDSSSYVQELEDELNSQKKTLELAEKEIQRLKDIITKFLNKVMEKSAHNRELKNAISKR